LIGSLRIVGAFPLLLILLLSIEPIKARELLRWGWSEWRISCLTAALLGINIWLFAAAPLWGEADGLAQGYLFLPVCLAALDLYRGESLSKPVLCGIALATVGSMHSVLSAPHLSSMALYFDLHKRRALSLLQRVVSDFALLAPFCCVALAVYGDWDVIRVHWLAAVGLGGLTTLAYIFYLGASKALSHTVFGVLSLLEPVGLAVIAVVLYVKQVSYMDLALMVSGAVLVSMPTVRNTVVECN
jgi:chloramphenicol-sensitive protein RarD